MEENNDYLGYDALTLIEHQETLLVDG